MLLKPVENQPCYKPSILDNRLLAFLQCVVISSYSGNYTNIIKATPLEIPSNPLTKESESTDDVDKISGNAEEHALTAESKLNSTTNADVTKNVGKNVDDKRPPTDSTHSTALSIINQDMKTVKGFVEKDHMKEYAFSLHDLPGAQRSKQFYLDSIEILFRECSKGGGI